MRLHTLTLDVKDIYPQLFYNTALCSPELLQGSIACTDKVVGLEYITGKKPLGNSNFNVGSKEKCS